MQVPDTLIDEAARRFALLSDPTRLRILSVLLERGSLTVTELAGALGMAPPNLSQHLARLRSGGMVTRRRDGRSLHYSVADPSLQSLCELMCTSLQERTERLLAARARAVG